MRDKSLSIICDGLISKDISPLKNYKVYSSHSEIMRYIIEQQPISCIKILKSDVITLYLVMYLTNNTLHCSVLKIKEKLFMKNKLQYYKILLDKEEFQPDHFNFDSNSINIGAVMLPVLVGTSSVITHNANAYTVIDMYWNISI